MDQRYKGDSKFSFSKIAQFFCYWLLFSGISYCLKYLVMSALSTAKGQQIGNDYISLQEIHNTGAAFSLFSSHPVWLINSAIIAIVLVTLAVIIFSKRLHTPSIQSCAILNAGIAMNLIERISHGYIIDYIHLEFIKNCPVFNFPDVLIIIGSLGVVATICTKE